MLSYLVAGKASSTSQDFNLDWMQDILKFVRQHAAVSIDFTAKPPKTVQKQKGEL